MVAERLHAVQVGAGDPVVILGRKYDRDHDHEFWARLARVRIVAQVPNDFMALHMSPERWADVCRVLSATGARIIVYKPRNGVEPAGWFPLTDGYYAYRLSGRAAGE